jgi:beta-mannosidase
VANLADFVRKSQLANYEAFRAMYEGRNAKLFNPTTGVLTWMSNPAQPSFVWQLYHHDLEPNSSLFAVKKAAEMVHVQLNESNGSVEVINNLDVPLTYARAHLSVYDLNGSVAYQHDFDVSGAASVATNVGSVEWPAGLSAVHFVKLELRDSAGKVISENFYWRALLEHQDDLTALASLPVVTLDAKVMRRDVGGKSFFDVTLRNPGTQVALMAHLQLRRKRSNERVLPVYYSDNYVSLVANETRTITIEVATQDLKGDAGIILMDGWNVGVAAASAAGASVALNVDAQVDHWPVTGLPMIAGVK